MVLDERDREWLTQASCRNKPTALFFPGKGDGAAARAICRECPVRGECLEYALTDEPYPEGIFGGTDQRERAAIRRERRSCRAQVA
jgi:WhiB family redox-sensing transcriptional regulator